MEKNWMWRVNFVKNFWNDILVILWKDDYCWKSLEEWYVKCCWMLLLLIYIIVNENVEK